jgi:hypothetical protein
MVDALGSVLDTLNQSAGSEPLAGSDADTLLRRRLALFESFGMTSALARQAAHFRIRHQLPRHRRAVHQTCGAARRCRQHMPHP